MGPHGVPRGCQLSSQSGNGGSFEAQLSDRPADRPHTQTHPGSTHTEWFCSMKVTIRQVRSRHIQRRIVPPDPHRDPGPGRVDHLHHHTPVTVSKSPHNPGSQHSDHRTQCRAPDHTHTERHTAAGSVRHRPRSLTTAGVQVRSSSRTSTPTPNPRPTPTHPHSTLKSL